MPADNSKIFCNDPQHQMLAQQIYKRGLELFEEKKHTEKLLYNIFEAVISVDRNLKIIILNKAAENLTKLTTENAEGKNLKDVLELATEEGTPVTPQEYCFTPSGTIMENIVCNVNNVKKYLKLQSTVITNPQGQEECVVTFTDITKERLLDKSKDEFISIASHELRTPMTVIKSYLWMLENRKGGTLTNKQLEYLGKATRGVERMLSMINDTLNTSKIDQGKVQLKIEEVELKEFLEDTLPDFKIKADEKGLKLKVHMDCECKAVFCDKGKLREIITNLLGNSIKFTTKGWIQLKVVRNGDSFAKFEISDTGKGLDSADIPKLFQKFGRIDNSYQTVAEAGGTGLGLYIVKNMVESMGGNVGASSEGIGKGATFWFTLPCEYYEIPENLRGTAILTPAPVIETHVTSICPV